MPMVSFDLSDKLINVINNVSKELQISKNQFLKDAINARLEQLEDEEDARDCEEAIREFIASGEKGIPAEEVYKELGLE